MNTFVLQNFCSDSRLSFRTRNPGSRFNGCPFCWQVLTYSAERKSVIQNGAGFIGNMEIRDYGSFYDITRR